MQIISLRQYPARFRHQPSQFRTIAIHMFVRWYRHIRSTSTCQGLLPAIPENKYPIPSFRYFSQDDKSCILPKFVRHHLHCYAPRGAGAAVMPSIQNTIFQHIRNFEISSYTGNNQSYSLSMEQTEQAGRDPSHISSGLRTPVDSSLQDLSQEFQDGTSFRRQLRSVYFYLCLDFKS